MPNFLRCCGTRCGLILALAALFAGVALLPASAGAQQKKKAEDQYPPENKTEKTKDGGTIHFTYYRSLLGKNAPVILLLHQKGGNRLIWQGQGGFAPRMQAQGYAVITVDLRHHGESRDGGADAAAGGNANQNDKKKGGGKKAAAKDLKPQDYRAMADLDLEAVKRFIYEENQAENLNMNKIGIVGPEMGASVATQFAANDWLKEPHPDGQVGYQTPRGQDVRAIVLISPQTSFHGLAMTKAIDVLRNPDFNVAFLVCVGKNDTEDKGQAKKIFDLANALPNSDKRMYKYEYPGKLRGTDLIGKGLQIEDHMVAFFGEHLLKLDAQWKDRQSKLIKKK
ncbi:MAG: alpha/beta hydrolase family protein [Planctomycetales bacterium]